MIDIYDNLGNIYSYRQDYKKALEYYKKALKLGKKIKDKKKEANSLKNIGILYSEWSQYHIAETYLKQALVLSEKSDIVYLKTNVLHALGFNYTYQNKGHLAVKFLTQSLILSKELEYKEKIFQNYYFLSQAYMSIGNGEKAKQYYKKYNMLNQDANKKLNNLKIKYETEKQEQEIEILNKEQELNKQQIVIQDERMKNQRYMIYSFMFGFLLILAFAIVVLRQYREKKKANLKLFAKNKQISEQKEEIESSIKYAQRIQEAVLPDTDFSNTILKKHFIMFKPKDVVSGDFYWMAKTNEWSIIAVADCTGHGVPGAFMSMLGISFLNEIVRKSDVTETGSILNELRKSIIEALKQKGIEGEQKDGMDMSLIAINNKTNICQFAGANNPLYILHKEKYQHKTTNNLENLIEEIKPDKMPVSIYVRMDNFKTHTIQLNQGDRLFLFSDGMPDQFGGEKGKKFKYKPFKRILANAYNKTIEQQGVDLEDALNKWISYNNPYNNKSYEQIDDITVLGIEI